MAYENAWRRGTSKKKTENVETRGALSIWRVRSLVAIYTKKITLLAKRLSGQTIPRF
jgi:hypothetical protein